MVPRQSRPNSARRAFTLRATMIDCGSVAISWNALPPRSDLLLETVAIQIVTASSEAFSDVIHLGRPRQFYYSPCDLPLTTVVEKFNATHGDLRPGFFLPQPSDVLDTIYGLAVADLLERTSV